MKLYMRKRSRVRKPEDDEVILITEAIAAIIYNDMDCIYSDGS